jgi:shikimate dehydrogenase
MIHLGLVGYPLEHSLSPVIHEAALSASAMQGKYVLYPIPPAHTEALHQLVERIRNQEIQGLNITIPHKQAILPFLDELTPAASAIGAVNTVYLRDGRVVGDNTDFAGFLADLQQWEVSPSSSIVLGAGGAARAVVFALRNMGCSVTLAARQLQPAQELARYFGDVTALPLTHAALRDVNVGLVVNATPAGMFPHVEACAWPAGLPLPQQAALYDLVYKPPQTRLIQLARTAGLRARNGLGMLIEQAVLAFELWTGCRVARSDLESALRKTSGWAVEV